MLPPGAEWESAPDLGANVRKAVHPDKKMKTAKTFKLKVLYEAELVALRPAPLDSGK